MMKTYNNCPIFLLNVDDPDATITTMSLVECPAMELPMYCFEKDKYKFEIQEAEHNIISCIIRTDYPILRMDADGKPYYVLFNKETSKLLCQKLMTDGYQQNISLDHNGELINGMQLQEVFMKDSAKGIDPKGFEEAADGSLFGIYHITDDDLWQACLDGKFGGVSLESYFKLEQFSKVNNYNVFISCVKTKADMKCKAKDMYISPLFKKCFELAMRLNSPNTYILSAKHHLLGLETEIEPYNETLLDMNAEERHCWTDEVYKEMQNAGIDFNARTYLFAGDAYIEYLRDYFPNRVEVFAEHGGIGGILEYLTELIDSNCKFSKNDILELQELYKQEQNFYKQNKHKQKMSKLREKIKDLLLSFSEVETDKGLITWEEDAQLEVGYKVYKDGEPAPDGEYVVDNKVFVVVDGAVAEVRDISVPNEENNKSVEEQMACGGKKKMEEANINVSELPDAVKEKDEDLISKTELEEDPRWADYAARIAAIESKIEELVEKLAELAVAPAAEPVVEEFEKAIAKKSTGNKSLDKRIALASALKELK